MRREIKLKDGADAQKLASTFKVTTRTVYNALAGKTENDLSNKIRHLAMKLYEANYVKTMPNEGVVTTRAEGVITHYFYGKTKTGEPLRELSLCINTKTGVVTEYLDGKIKKAHGNISIGSLNSLISRTCESVNLEYDKYFEV